MKIKKLISSCKLGDSKQRIIEENYVLLNFILVRITPIFAYFLKNSKISPNLITIISYQFIFIGVYLLLQNNLEYAAYCWLIFAFFDSLDGSYARLTNQSSYYGKLLDTLGADIFYFFFFVSSCYYLSNNGNFVNIFKISHFTFVGLIISFLFFIDRYCKKEILSHRLNKKKSIYINKKKNSLFTKIYLSIFQNFFIKGNFFSEPGLITIFFIFSITKFFYFFEIWIYLNLIYIFFSSIISIRRLNIYIK